MSNGSFSNTIDRALGHVGLFLMLVVAKAANRAYSEPRTVRDRLAGFLARRAIDVSAGIGWVADRLPQPGASRVPARPSAAGLPPRRPVSGIASRVREWRV